MSIDQHVSVTVTVNNAGIALEGFGTIGILTYKTLWPERIRRYARLTDVIADGFAADSPEALAVSVAFSQSPHPPEVAIIRGDLPPTQRYLVEVTDVENEFEYQINVKGEGVTATTALYESDLSATLAEIHSGLVSSLNGVVGNNYLAAFEPLVFPDATFVGTPASDIITFGAPHGLETGDGPFQLTTTGTLPAGLLTVTDYWFIRLTTTTGQFATSLANALAGTFVDFTDVGTGVHTMSDTGSTASPSGPFTVTADDPGDWFSLELLDTSVMSIAQNHVNPGIATDLAAIELADSDWYYLHTFFNSEAMVLAAAAWVEGTPFKAYVVDVVDSASENVAAGGGDVLDDLGLLGYKRTLPFYHRKPNEMLGAGVEGRLAPLAVGSWTAAYKTIAGATRDIFTTTQTTNLDAKRASYYKAEAGRSITWEGKVGNTDFGFLDVTVALDFVVDLIQKRTFGIFVALNKVAYTDEDIAVLAGAVEGAIDIAKSDRHKIVAPGTPGSDTDPPPTVTFPKVADIDPGTRALRELPDGAVFFRMQGAVHKVFIDLTVTF